MKLFEPIQIREYRIKNRVVMPPMVCFGKTEIDGLVTQRNIEHYELRAKNNVGLIITEALSVDKKGGLSENQIGIWSDLCIDGLQKITQQCHVHGAIVFAQIHHAGLTTKLAEKITASDFEITDREGKVTDTARGLTTEEVRNIEQKYIDAAIRAEKAGFDGVELHGAHGYLLCQFFSPVVNQRTDEYGGEIVNRARIASNIIKAIRKATNPDFVIGIRMGSCEPTLVEGAVLAKIFEENGADYLNISTGYFTGEKPVVPKEFPGNWIAYGAVEIKKHVKIPVLAVNQITTPEQANYFIENQLVDMVCIGRGLLADPQWAAKAQREESIELCAGCKPCGWFKSSGVCIKNGQKK